MSQKRRIVYVSGSRADFGLIRSTLHLIHQSKTLDLAVVATGMHLSALHGMTISDIESSGLPIGARVAVDDTASTGATMAKNIGRMLEGFVDTFEQLRPDVVLVLGDRGEMLAAALAAIHLNIPVAHIHGGERSGTVDEPVRHAISKLSHIHFVATEESAERLSRMGEAPERILVVGAPGLDGLVEDANIDRDTLFGKYHLDTTLPLALMLFHPVLQEASVAGKGGAKILDALGKGLQVLALNPNSDAGSEGIRAELETRARNGDITLVTHLPRVEYLSFLRHADLLIGNSSSGIIEAATFGIPVVNVGTRQSLRQRNSNVIDVPVSVQAIRAAVAAALSMPRGKGDNVYGDGQAGARIVAYLADAVLDDQLMRKINAY